MKYYSSKIVKPTDLNPGGTLFGGTLLGWIDEDAAIFVISKLRSKSIVTKYMSEINFVNSARNGDIIEIGFEVVAYGRTSITIKSQVRNKLTRQEIIRIDKIVFVHINANGRPSPHGIIQQV